MKVAIAITRNHFIAGATDGQIKLWDRMTRALQHTLMGHNNAVRSIVVDNDGTIISSSDDKTCRMWSSDGQCLDTQQLYNIPTALLQQPDATLMIGSGNDVIYWKKHQGKLHHIKTVGFNAPIKSIALLKDKLLLIRTTEGLGSILQEKYAHELLRKCSWLQLQLLHELTVLYKNSSAAKITLSAAQRKLFDRLPRFFQTALRHNINFTFDY